VYGLQSAEGRNRNVFRTVLRELTDCVEHTSAGVDSRWWDLLRMTERQIVRHWVSDEVAMGGRTPSVSASN